MDKGKGKATLENTILDPNLEYHSSEDEDFHTDTESDTSTDDDENESDIDQEEDRNDEVAQLVEDANTNDIEYQQGLRSGNTTKGKWGSSVKDRSTGGSGSFK